MWIKIFAQKELTEMKLLTSIAALKVLLLLSSDSPLTKKFYIVLYKKEWFLLVATALDHSLKQTWIISTFHQASNIRC